ncbi:MAG TPA: NADH-quinone oxidoreductase subunit J [Hyphomicrobiaceae bacterium]|jgi:NADH-quinone oxidoreductase subunit J
MTAAFYIAAVVAVLATIMVIIETNAVHALLNLIVSLLAVAIVFYVLGAPFAAALEVIVYAGAIMVLFVFVIMMLNLGEAAVAQERRWLAPRMWMAPAGLSAVLLGELIYMLWQGPAAVPVGTTVTPREVGALFFGPYLLVVELASMLLLAGLVGAYHLGRRERAVAKPEMETAREAQQETQR